jgi:CDP-diacylglycerol---glycerol-3-phosphate 3-phosphatidyltransferase
MIEGIKPQYQAALKPIAALCALLGITPNMITFLGVIFFAGSGLLLALGHWYWALGIGLAGAFMDGIDGLLASMNNQKTVFGAIFDSTCDRFTEIFVIGGIMTWYLRNSNHADDLPAALVCFLAITGSLLVPYVRARCEGAGVACKGGFFQRPERLIFMGLLVIGGPKIMLWGLAALAVLSYGTTVQRILAARKACITTPMPPGS